VLGDDGTAAHDAAHTFEFYQDKAIDELPDESGDAAGVGDPLAPMAGQFSARRALSHVRGLG